MSLALVVDFIRAVDALLLVAGAAAAKLVYIDGYLGNHPSTLPYIGIGILAALVQHLVYRQLELYHASLLRKPSVGVGKVLFGLLLTFLFVLALLYLLKTSETYSRGWMLVWFAASFMAITTARIVIRRHVRLMVAEGRLHQRVAVYGGGTHAATLIEHVATTCPELDIVAVYDDQGGPTRSRRLELTGGLQTLIAHGRAKSFDQIIVALPASEAARIRKVVERLDVLPLELQLCIDSAPLPIGVHGCHQLGHVFVHQVKRQPVSERGQLLKAALDYTLSAVAILLLAPFLLLIAAAIKVDSKGPILFRQRRHGYNNSVFSIYKFRTMSVMEDGPVIAQATKNDHRTTRVGGLLRRTSIDELPQLFNVLKGEMSLVGPRPHAVAHNDAYTQAIERYERRHSVKPGITGWAQVHGFRGETKTRAEMRQRMDYDFYYIDNWTIWLDLEILFRTILAVLSGRKAY